MHIGDAVHNTVVFLGYRDPDSSSGFECRGTGFLASFERDGYLVTVRHTAAKLGDDPFLIRVNRRGTAELLDVDSADWTPHPDPLVDLAVMPLNLVRGQGYECEYFPEKFFFTRERIRDEGLGVGDFCYTVGLFHFIHGKGRNLPFVHTGNIALMPPDGETVPIASDDQKSTEWVQAYLIESRAIEGASGSPVYARSTITNSHPLRTQVGDLQVYFPVADIGLLGIFQGAWFLPPDDVLQQTVRAKKEDVVPVGIGIVIPCDKIIEIFKMDKLKTLREKRPTGAARKTGIGKPKKTQPPSREDFNRLLGAAVKPPKPSDQT